MLAGCAHAVAPGDTVFGVMGDAPYNADEVQRLERLIDEMNAQPLAFVAHVGDIGSGAQACSDPWLLQRKTQFGRLRHSFVLLPGDNEWTDCRQPLARLASFRNAFCGPVPGLATEVQKGEFCEHRRWETAGWVFVALNVPGSNNNMRHPEHAPRMKVVLQWLDQGAALAERREGLVVLMQANPFITFPRDGYEPLRERLAALGERRPGRVVLIHGDTHVYRQDEPFPGVRRIEVWGSPIVSWLRISLRGAQLRVDAVR